MDQEQKIKVDQLEDEIASLKSKIKNTEYDLAHMFKGNNIVKQKLDNTKKLLEEKQALLTELSGNNDKEKNFKELKENIAEKNTIPVSSDQEQIIEETIEEELM